MPPSKTLADQVEIDLFDRDALRRMLSGHVASAAKLQSKAGMTPAIDGVIASCLAHDEVELGLAIRALIGLRFKSRQVDALELLWNFMHRLEQEGEQPR